MNELQDFKNIFEEEIKIIFFLILEEITKELKKEEDKKNKGVQKICELQKKRK